MPQLNPDILKKLVQKTELSKNTIRKEISLLKRKFPNCTLNAIAQLYASKHGFSVMQKLSKEDKETLPNHETEKAIIKIKEKKTRHKEKLLELIKYETNDHFQKGHIDEINKAYTNGCYTSAYILSRKVIENLIIDVLRKKFPPVSIDNKEIYYDTTRRRYKGFEIVLKNLFDKRHEFEINSVKPIQRLYEKSKDFKGGANDATHSWFYLITKKKEMDELDIQSLINLINHIEKEL